MNTVDSGDHDLESSGEKDHHPVPGQPCELIFYIFNFNKVGSGIYRFIFNNLLLIVYDLKQYFCVDISET